MRACSTCTTKNRECISSDVWESCLGCIKHGEAHCDALLDLSHIAQSTVQVKILENERRQLQATRKQDSDTLASLASSIKAKQATLSATTSSGADSAGLQAEIEQLIFIGKLAFGRYQGTESTYDQTLERFKELQATVA
jgi:hypothetical protein